MVKFFTYVPIVLAWLPEIVKAVMIIEAVLDPKVPGAEKKQAVLAYLSQVAEKSKLPWGDQAVEVISSVIDTVVGIFNFLRVFLKGGETADAVEAPPVVTADAVNERVADAMAHDPVLDSFLSKTPKAL
jgi:hypothetical protein